MPLIIDNVSKSFGGVVALDSVCLRMLEGDVTAIVGGNGAGKSTLFNIVCGYVRPDRGQVLLSHKENGQSVEISGMPPHRVANNGVGMLFQSVRVFERLSVLDNVLTAFPAQRGEGVLSALFGRGVSASEKANTEEAMSLLRTVGLTGKENQPAGKLSFGEQKLLSIARILAAKARVLLLDEPTSGVHPKLVEHVLSLIISLARKESRIVALIEHNPRVVRQVADITFTIERGRLVSSTGKRVDAADRGEPATLMALSQR